MTTETNLPMHQELYAIIKDQELEIAQYEVNQRDLDAKIESLLDEVEMWKATANATVDFEMSALKQEIEVLTSRLAAVKVMYNEQADDLESLSLDAARYRWLCDRGSNSLWIECGRMDACDDVDAAIDAAIERLK
jgi:hypothetical protein